MAIILDGKVVAASLQRQLQSDLQLIQRPIRLGILQVGDNPASNAYIRRKTTIAKQLGIDVLAAKLDNSTTTQQVIDHLASWNADSGLTGYIVQLPLPEHINQPTVIHHINPEKDADSLTPYNIGLFFQQHYSILPATTRGVLSLLGYYQLELANKHVVVVGRSNLVGKPTAVASLHHNATVTITHSQSKKLPDITRQADILILAIGQPGFITRQYIKQGAVIIDIGISATDDGLKGDVDFDDVLPIAGAITPVPGGIGPLTVISLMQNLVELAKKADKSI
jgi:methylenetetrahydrofolate dehydrogenase (NADP+) / methenyltetrahydrofolate cyclohydrolase